MCSILYLAVLWFAISTFSNANGDKQSLLSTDAKAGPPFSFDAIMPLIVTGAESIGVISSGLQQMDLDDGKQLLDPFNKCTCAFAAMYQQLAVYNPSENSTELVQMQQRLVTLELKYSYLDFLAGISVDNVAPLFFKKDLDILKAVQKYLYAVFRDHIQAIRARYNSHYATNVVHSLGLLQDSCANNDTRSIFKEVYMDLSGQLLQDNLISVTDWAIADITKMATDLFATFSTFAMMQSVCLGVKVAATDTKISSTLQYTIAAFSHFATLFDQVQVKLRTDFYKGDRLKKEVSKLIQDPSNSNKLASQDIYYSLDKKYSFNSWFVHVYDDTDSPDNHYIADSIVTEFGHLLLAKVHNKNILVVWSDNSIPLSITCPMGNVIKQNDCGSGKTKECTTNLATAITKTCGTGYANVMYFTSKVDGYLFYDANKYAVSTLTNWIGAATRFKYDGSDPFPPLEATAKSNTAMQISKASESLLKSKNLWLLLVVLFLSFTVGTRRNV